AGSCQITGHLEMERLLCNLSTCTAEPFPVVYQPPEPVQVNCGDQRDQIIQEYVDFGVNFTPGCSDFTQSINCQNIALSEYTQDDDFSWFILRSSLCTGFNATRTNFGAAIPLSSGYRNPAANQRVGGVQNSFHVKGTAVDMDGLTVAENQAIFNAMAGTNFVERIAEPDFNNATRIHGAW
ncbi:MAG: D-Ala-D-Ala carboxypeptidase family metallohydrolase, partial [Acidobacteriota bacterium]